MSVRIHPTALVEDGVVLGPGTSVWDTVHIRSGARIGRDCIIGGKTYIAGDTVIGDRVKINAMVYIPALVHIGDGVMIAAGTVFTNDRYPRATTPDLETLRSSAVDDQTLATRVREGATIGARAVIGCDLEIGRFAMVGMGAVVTRPVPDFHLVAGSPARTIAYVCRCGEPFARAGDGDGDGEIEAGYPACGRHYRVRNGIVTEMAHVRG